MKTRVCLKYFVYHCSSGINKTVYCNSSYLLLFEKRKLQSLKISCE